MKSNNISNNLANALDMVPEMTEKKRRIDLHTNIATHLLTEVKNRQLDKYFEKVNLNLGSIKISNSKNISIIKLGTGDITLDIVEQNRDFLIENGMGDVDLNINNMLKNKCLRYNDLY